MDDPTLPYREQDLERHDAIGSRAKREAVAYWMKRARHCQRHASIAEQDCQFYAKRVNDEDARTLHASAMNRKVGWNTELHYANQRVHELEKLVKEAWA